MVRDRTAVTNRKLDIDVGLGCKLMTLKLRYGGKLFRSPITAAAKVLSPKVLCVQVTTHVRLSVQGDHLSGKPGNVRELYRCQGNVRDFTKSQGNVRELSGKKSCHGKLCDL